MDMANKPRKIKRVLWSKDRPKRPDVDPLLSELRAALVMDKRTYHAKANSSGLAPATIKHIIDGKTRRPQGVTMQMAYRMLGFELKPVRVVRKKGGG
jgi:hypothetical protein